MLISITDKCRMNCTHCMEDAKETNNNFMSFETFKDAVEFNLKYDKTMVISGGEPTEHPEFWKFIEWVADRVRNEKDVVVTIATNGMNLVKNEEADRLIKKYYETNKDSIRWQVTNDIRYYPIRVNSYERVFRTKSVKFFDHLISLYPQGRAGSNHTSNINVPKCFNLRINIKNGFKQTIKGLRKVDKYCTPKIIYNGDLKMGESHLCPSVASIYDDEATIEMKMRSSSCRGCKTLFDENPNIENLLKLGEYIWK